MREDPERVGALLSLPAVNIQQEDGTRAKFEEVFQQMDADGSKGVTKEEWITYFSTSADKAPGATLALAAAPAVALVASEAKYPDGAAAAADADADAAARACAGTGGARRVILVRLG